MGFRAVKLINEAPATAPLNGKPYAITGIIFGAVAMLLGTTCGIVMTKN
jgi:hypothetical protein